LEKRIAEINEAEKKISIKNWEGKYYDYRKWFFFSFGRKWRY
jgi:hypothetical protein